MRILVAENDYRLASSIKRGLEAEGFAVDIARDGRAGLARAEIEEYDVLVLDVVLPVVSGYRMCARLRRAGNWTPILMLAAEDGEHGEVAALDTGADDVLSKPFSLPVLSARLRALMRRYVLERPAVLTAGDLSLDPASHRVRRGSAEITLTARQFSVLEFLMRRAGDVVGKRTILEHVWDFAHDGDPNIVEVHVRHLRQKIDEPFGRRAIETVRLVGYRLNENGG